MASEGGQTAVVTRLPDGTHGVALFHESRTGLLVLTLCVAEWRALLPKIEAACALAEKPGQLP